MEPKTGKRVHIVMGSGYPKDGSVRPLSGLKTDKRIVSKGEYVRLRGKQESLRLIGLCLLVCAVLSGFATVCMAVLMGINFIGCAFDIVFGAVTYQLGKWGLQNLDKAAEIEPGVPLTSANTANLPAPDSLVRASSEPLQAQQAVLLRAAAEGQETPPEQMVRASVGEE